MKRAFTIVIKLLSILLAFSFVAMAVNIMLYYGFRPSMIHSTPQKNPFNLSPAAIWCMHLVTGFAAGMVFSKKHYLLAGFMGLFCAAIITGVSIVYFGWRISLVPVELFIPLAAGILPTVKLFDYLKKRTDKNKHEPPGCKID